MRQNSRRTWTPASPRPRGCERRNSLHPTYCPEAGPSVCSLQSAGGGGRENGGGQLDGYKGQDGDLGGAGSLRLGPHTSSPSPTLRGSARPPPAEIFPNQRSTGPFPSARTKMHPTGLQGARRSLCPEPRQTAQQGWEGWTDINERGLNGNVRVSQGMH